jgi:hypothetical protein
MNRFINKFFFCAAVIWSTIASAQKDTTGKGGVDIISSFKPVLHQTAKINFNASPPPADSSKPKLSYDIPNQNLLFGYQPGTLKPLAMNIDSANRFNNSSYVKAGFGSLRTPYIQAGISFGDGHTAGLNIYAKHVASEGKLDYQNFSMTDVNLKGYFKSGNNLQWNGAIGMRQDRTYKYGYPATLNFPTDSIRQNFQTITGRLAMQNINPTAFGLIYSPEAKIDVFSDNHQNSESNTVLNLPLQKRIGNEWAVNLGLTFDLSRVSPHDKSVINNTMYYIAPSVLYRTSKLNIQAGIRPSWDNKTFKMFPNILADINTPDSRFVFQLGWTGYVRKTTYQYLASQNPWLRMPLDFRNTWIEERFAGFKGSVGDHFTYAAKVAFNKWNNQPLFINDTATIGDAGKSFRVVYEPRINVINLGGEVGFTIHEKFSLVSGLTFNQYSGLKNNAEPWGLIPLELKAAMRLQIIKDLWLKGDLYAWTGPQYMKKDGSPGRLRGASDLNAGLEFRITKNLNLWTQFNNIFNKQYQRWNQYPVYGFNFVGGIVFSFDQKN